VSKYLIVNFDRQEYLRPEDFGEAADLGSIAESHRGVMLALVVLLADGNNRGGGDLRSDAQVIGSWVGSRVAIVDDTVVNPQLAQPGMETVPLQEQLLKLGRNVGAEVTAAIIDGEGKDCPLGTLNPNLTLSLLEQRKLPGRGGEYMRSFESRQSKPLEDLEDLFSIFGAKCGMTPDACRQRLEEGLAKMATLLGRTERYRVDQPLITRGAKMVTQQWSDERARGFGVIKFEVKLQDTALEKARKKTLKVKFGPKGSTLAELYEVLFPGVVLETMPAVTVGVKSPEVVKLLTMLNLKGD